MTKLDDELSERVRILRDSDNDDVPDGELVATALRDIIGFDPKEFAHGKDRQSAILRWKRLQQQAERRLNEHLPRVRRGIHAEDGPVERHLCGTCLAAVDDVFIKKSDGDLSRCERCGWDGA
jgi:hypothetical protein